MSNNFRKKDIEFLNFLFRFGILVIFFSASVGIISIGLGPSIIKLREGDVAPSAIYAPFNFSYPSGIDEAKTAIVRQRAVESAVPVYDAVKDAFGQARLFVVKSDSRIRELLKGRDVDVEEYKDKLNKMLGLLYESYIIDSQARKELEEKKKESVIVRETKLLLKKTVKVDELSATDDLIRRFDKRFEELFPEDAKLQGAALEIVKDAARPSIVLNEEETRKAEEASYKGVHPVYEFREVKKNELIVEKGQRITKAHLAMMNAIKRFEGRTDILSYVAGIALFMSLFITIFYVYLKRTEPKVIGSLKYLGVVALLAIILIAVCKVLALSSLNSYMAPFASTTMLIAVLVSPNAAVIGGVLLSVICGVIFGGRLDAMLVFLVSGLVGIYAVRNLRSRFQIILAGGQTGLASFAAIVALGLQTNSQAHAYLYDSLWGILNGILSSFVVMGLLPVIERSFKISTNITLLELSDMSHPLLKELALKAPGTYLHSHLVGNLAEAACEEIGANALLARIGSYYHDIGKIDKAEYFSENETTFKSKHEKLRPSMSSLVIGNHVKEGVELAEKHHLNRQIIDMIQQHHGTSLMYFFYKRALEEINGEGPLKEQDYRYQGPKPQTKEAAVVLLADSVEASSRTLTEPTPGKIRNMVQRIINNKFIDNQLDECDLTLRDLFKITEAFVRVLIAAFHVRTEYSEKREKAGAVIDNDNKSQ